MSDTTTIEWTDATWTPIRARRIELQADGSGKERIGWHCEHASPGCIHCYAEGINKRLGTGVGFKPVHLIHKTPLGDKRGDVTVFLDEEMLLRPLKWKRPRMVFVCSMTDLAAGFVSDEWIISVLAVVALAPTHTFQALTKRADRLAALLTRPGMRGRVIGRAWEMLWRLPKYKHEVLSTPWPLPNLWVGASVEDQRFADERRHPMAELAGQGWLTWVSYEPALGPVDWGGWEFARWMVSGGESGRKARPTHPGWHRATRDWCAAAGVAFLFKQWGEFLPASADEADPTVADVPESRLFWSDGSKWDRFDGQRASVDIVARVGKKSAGRLLDGVEHNGFPHPERRTTCNATDPASTL